jgi:hypothetical protein
MPHQTGVWYVPADGAKLVMMILAERIAALFAAEDEVSVDITTALTLLQRDERAVAVVIAKVEEDNFILLDICCSVVFLVYVFVQL